MSRTVKREKMPGISREEEELYLSDTLELAQKNLDDARAGVQKINEDLEDLMEVYESTDKEGLFLWNNAKAQLKEAVSSLARYEKARKKPYFGRIDFTDTHSKKEEAYYIGRTAIAREDATPCVIDWRTPVASVYYDNAIGRGTYTVSSEGVFEIDLKRKRTYEIEEDQLKDFYDLDVVANDELLTKYLSKNKSEVLGEIIATIQKEQNRIIRRSPKTNMIVQGGAGSGKTTVAMHRISYILYNFAEEFRPEDFYIIGGNKILLNYITSVLPDLDVYGVSQMTMEQLFIRLLYEDWNDQKYTIRRLDKADQKNIVKGSLNWFKQLESYCAGYEWEHIPRDAVYLENTGRLLLETERIESYIREHPQISMQSKRLMLNEILYSRYENETIGKYFDGTPEEKKKQDKKYAFYYGKDGWKGSVFELYREFLKKQAERGAEIDIPDTSFDVYDLAALAYLYKRIKEIDPIREATHVVIDEAQDFGMMAYSCLNYCLRGCTYTIMGDTSQNIHYEYGLNDWEDLKKLFLTGIKDTFRLLRKSYRNTVEISEFATEILRHGDFSIYPAEPIIRHGTPVQTESCESEKELLSRTVQAVKSWMAQGYETIAVVCRDDEEADRTADALQKEIEVKKVDPEETEFGSGVFVLSVAYTKGLEFDTVLLYDPSAEKYPPDNGHVKMLYVAATRALHELLILHTADLTPLIAEKAPADKHMEELPGYVQADEEEEVQKLTRKEIIERDKADMAKEMSERSYIGPERIQPLPLKTNTAKAAAQGSAAVKTEPVNHESVKAASQQTRLLSENAVRRSVRKINSSDNTRPVNTSTFKFGEFPAISALAVKGHSRADLSVRWIKKTKSQLEVTSSYGTLTLTPITETCIRVSFVRGIGNRVKETFWKAEAEKNLTWTAKESPSLVEVATKKLIIRIEKKNGALKFMTPDRRLLLAEREKEPRLIEGSETWSFFEFDKSEKLKAKGVLATDQVDLTCKTKYISFGAKPLRMPLIVSGKGYGIAVASEKTVLFCGIPMYGQYVYTEGAGQIDYYFMYQGSFTENIDLCDRFFK